MRHWDILVIVFVAMVCVGSARPGMAEGLLADQETVLRAIARGESQPWPPMTPEQVKALYEKAEEQLRDHQAYHIPHGLSVDVFWTDYSRTQPFRYETVGDSACWTGHYLAALALRYRVTRDPRTLKDIQAVIEKMDVLTKVSGRLGYIARYAGPAEDAAYREYYKVYGRGEDPGRPGLGKWAYRGAEPYQELVWLGNSSRDTYDGFNFGMAAAWAYVPDETLRGRIRSIVETVALRLVEDDFHVIDGQGHVTTPTGWWRLAWMRTIATAAPDRFPNLVSEYYEGVRKAIEAGNRVCPITYKEYFANNLTFIRMYALCTLETDPDVKAGLQGVLRTMYEGVKDHLNAHFAAIYLAATGDANESAAATLQGQLIDLPGPPRWTRLVDYRNSSDITLREDTDYVQYALLAHEQAPSDFIWQRSPVLSHGSADASYEFPGIDLFLPYWMGRAAGVIPGP